MEKTGVQKLAAALKLLVTITFICNLIVLPLVPGLVGASTEPSPVQVGPVVFLLGCWQYLFRVWRNEYAAVLTVFLLFCGTCTAVILWQARRVLDTILREDTFTFVNAANLRRAALCFFLISAAALVRTVWGVCFFRSPMPLFTYNALFCPIFLMAGLLCQVMSALFRQAAELKAENDLTI